MSETRDETTGQFAPTPEPLFGKEGIERDQGYVPFNEDAEEQPELTVAEAAEQLTAARAPESEIRTYSPVDNLPDHVSLTIEQAAKIGADQREAEAKALEEAKAEEIRAEVDELRGAKPEDAKADELTSDGEVNSETVKDGETDPEVEKFWKIPKVREAVERVHAETEQVKQAYSKGIEVANDFARAAFVENFPDIAALPPAQWESALIAMRQQQPERFNQAMGTLNRVQQLQAAQQQQRQQQQLAEQARLQNYVKAESARFEETIKDVPRAQRMEVEGEIASALQERGANPEEIVRFLKTSEFSSALVTGLLWELGDLRRQVKAIRSAPKAVASRNLPPVQRPGSSSGARASSPSAQMASLEKALDTATGDRAIRISAQLQSLKRASRG